MASYTRGSITYCESIVYWVASYWKLNKHYLISSSKDNSEVRVYYYDKELSLTAYSDICWRDWTELVLHLFSSFESFYSLISSETFSCLGI